MSGKIITRVRERQEMAERNARLLAAAEAKKAEYLKLRAAALREMAERKDYSGRYAGTYGGHVVETPGAYASDPISRFFRCVFRL
ncbi:MAG: hypothetical protein RL227_1402 [Pseudomonadota bacterium]|jgi:hypothetical protein